MLEAKYRREYQPEQVDKNSVEFLMMSVPVVTEKPLFMGL